MSESLPLVIALGDVDGAVVRPVLEGHARWVPNPSESEVAEAVGAIVRAHIVVDATALDSMPQLRVIARTGVGTEKVDVAEATSGESPSSSRQGPILTLWRRALLPTYSA
jgi:D-3-phosphoglycerate dehydrogenase